VLDWSKRYFAEHGSTSPRLDAEILLAHACGWPRIQLYTHFDDILNEDVRARMRELVKRRAAHEPVAYLVGHREFFSLEFEINRDVFIPRPETETLVMETLEVIAGSSRPRVLDVGTGSGCIAVAIAVHARTAAVTAIDLSEAALAVARRNAARHGIAERVTFLQGDLLEPLPDAPHFDVIVSNPPYVATTDVDRLPPDVTGHEPHQALFAGADGLDTIRRLIEQSPQCLAPGGVLLIEFSPEQATGITALLTAHGAYTDVTIVRDLHQNLRVVRAVRRSG
jgi:release factor glutamine methyltransferase